jgi:hypothetical protein
MKKSLLALLMLLVLPGLAPAYVETTTSYLPEIGESEKMRFAILSMLQKKNIAAIDLTLQSTSASGERYVDGRWMADVVASAIEDSYRDLNDYDSELQNIEQLKKQYKDSPTLVIMESGFWNGYAWSARGHGYAGSVTDVGWKLFRERQLRRRDLLDATRKSMSDAYPWWHKAYLDSLGVLGAPVDVQERAMREATTKFKYYYPLYFTYGLYRQPQWQGSWQAFEDFARYAVKNTRDQEGMTLYARLYWSADQSLSAEERLWDVSLASWPDMKKGFEDLMQRYPKSRRNVNSFASFACRADDRKTYLELRKQFIYFVRPVWKDNFRGEVCDELHGYVRPAAVGTPQ